MSGNVRGIRRTVITLMIEREAAHEMMAPVDQSLLTLHSNSYGGLTAEFREVRMTCCVSFHKELRYRLNIDKVLCATPPK